MASSGLPTTNLQLAELELTELELTGLQLAELQWADLRALRETISRSQIYLARLSLAARLADWQRTRASADVDDVILAWLRSQAPARTPAALS